MFPHPFPIPARQPGNKLASLQARQPVSQPASQPLSQPGRNLAQSKLLAKLLAKSWKSYVAPDHQVTTQLPQQAMTENPIELRNRCSDFEASDSDEEEEVNDEDFDEEKSDMYSLPPSNPSDDQWHVTDTDIDEDDEVESLSDGEAHETSAEEFSHHFGSMNQSSMARIDLHRGVHSMATSDNNPQERDYSAGNKAARRLRQQADAEERSAIGEQNKAIGSAIVLRDAAAAAQPSTMQCPQCNQMAECIMQCPACNQIICDTHDLAFFKRTNKQHGLEVHLMLKPEITDMPPAMISMPACDPKAVAFWECACCQHKLGETRNVGPRKATMTAFKSSSVKLFGLHNKSKKSQWPRMHVLAPFNAIEVRLWDEYFPNEVTHLSCHDGMLQTLD